MKMKQLKALASITTKSINGIKPRSFLQHVFMYRDSIYAANDWMVIKVTCCEIKSSHPNFDTWACLDLEACAAVEREKRYVDLNDPAVLDFSDAAIVQCGRMTPDYFDRFFSMELDKVDTLYDPELMQLVCKVFKAFDVDMHITFDAKRFQVFFEGENSNYFITAFVMPKRR